MKETMRAIKTDLAPKAVGPYSQAIFVPSGAHLLFVSGQLPLDPATGTLVQEDSTAATRQALDNIEAILLEAKSSFRDVVRVDIFVKDLNDFPKINEEYKKRFTNGVYPARQTVQVSRLPLDALVEISCIAAFSTQDV